MSSKLGFWMCVQLQNAQIIRAGMLTSFSFVWFMWRKASYFILWKPVLSQPRSQNTPQLEITVCYSFFCRITARQIVLQQFCSTIIARHANGFCLRVHTISKLSTVGIKACIRMYAILCQLVLPTEAGWLFTASAGAGTLHIHSIACWTWNCSAEPNWYAWFKHFASENTEMWCQLIW